MSLGEGRPSLFFSFTLSREKKGRRKEMDEDIWDPLEEVEMEELDSSDEG